MTAPVRVHFIGFRGEEYWSAVRIWGKPDFVHLKAQWSNLGEIAPEDIVIFGPQAFSLPKKWRDKSCRGEKKKLTSC